MRVLGLDSGGTKTLLAVALPTGQVTEFRQGPGLDPTAGKDWEQDLITLLQPCAPMQAAVLGLAYFSEIPAISARQTAIAQAVLGLGAEVVNDVAVAYEGALGGADGVLVLSGTGSMAWARGPAGVVRCGGWGDVFGDEGSAYWIGRAALALVSRHLDGRQDAEAFAAGMLDAIGIIGAELIAWTYGQTQPRAAVAALARDVVALAEQNQDAAEIVRQAAAHLVEMGRSAARRADLPRGHRWSFAGGVFASDALRGAVTTGMGSPPTPPRLPPVGGAVIAAARRAGWVVDETFIATLAGSLADGSQV
ncbi:MAG: BadF/BadG/BcrA/BcrD ATPase family protein [Alphaproteobacteria bacterium]